MLKATLVFSNASDRAKVTRTSAAQSTLASSSISLFTSVHLGVAQIFTPLYAAYHEDGTLHRGFGSMASDETTHPGTVVGYLPRSKEDRANCKILLLVLAAVP